jgi:hypothetical protein
MLERKRVLKVKEQIKKEGTRVFIYEHPPTGDIFTITDPNLQLNQLDQVQRDVSSLMEHGINPPQAAATAPAAEGTPIELAPIEVTADTSADQTPAAEPQAVTDGEPAATT